MSSAKNKNVNTNNGNTNNGNTNNGNTNNGKEDVDQEDESEAPLPVERFDPDEEVALITESNSHKAQANKLFASTRYSEAIGTYDQALATLPNYLDYEIAVLQSNISACHLKLDDWKAAVDSATKSLDSLEKLLPQKKRKKERERKNNEAGKGKNAEEGREGDQDDDNDDDTDENGHGVVEISGDDASAEKQLRDLQMSDLRREDVRRIRVKALMRRAKGRAEQGGWGNLAAAEEDYKILSQIPNLPSQDTKIVKSALATLPPRINAAKEKEMGDMMGKLKELGNGLLKPFGLSTDMFKMQQDPQTGGYNMSFGGGGGGAS